MVFVKGAFFMDQQINAQNVINRLGQQITQLTVALVQQQELNQVLQIQLEAMRNNDANTSEND